MQSITIKRPDDWHVHFRDEENLIQTVNATAAHFSRALVMPNLKPPLIKLDQILAYRHRILSACDPKYSFKPMMTFFINESSSEADYILACQYPFIMGAKLYPAGATTNSDQGASSLKALYPLFDVMEQRDLVLQIHGETVKDDIFDREKLFLTESLQPIMDNFPKLRIVLEHISTKAAVDFVEKAGPQLGATITIHHLLYNRNHLLSGGIKPHFYCLPILKRMEDQQAIQRAALSGNPAFFAGTDSAPHRIVDKQSQCGCAGIYSAPYALPLYAQFFEAHQQLNKLEAFMSIHGAGFYQQPANEGTITLNKQAQLIPDTLPFGHDSVRPIAAGQTIEWSVVDEAY
ncbi:dihydroorotase [Legionella sp. W05-934-2]|jgi:dihydroorotase|uniref:dihydroorotase n=1 Tax=Legionella sp. W05-934-2 TaxID=1198649 RepID=UPI0034630333